MLLRASVLAVAVAAVLPACGGGGNDDAPPAPSCQGAADGAPPEIEIVYGDFGGTGGPGPADGGAVVPLISAPQGGHILLIGVRVHGVAATADCSMQVSAALRDTCNNRVIGLEQRPVNLRDDGTGWAAPVDPDGLSNYANVAVCPTVSAAHDLHDATFQVEVKLLDQHGGVLAEKTEPVTPVCQPGDTYCLCDCDLDQDAACGVAVDAAPGC